jgi:hypothetical protein
VFASDEPAELHLHGYDIYLSVEAGIPAVLRVDPKLPGAFLWNPTGSEMRPRRLQALTPTLFCYTSTFTRDRNTITKAACIS